MSRIASQEAIRKWIGEALTHKGWGQADLAREVWNGDRSKANKILKGRRNVQIDELPAIAAATGYKPFIATEPNEPPPEKVSAAGAELAARAPKFVRTKAFRFYIGEWREFMGVKVAQAAKAAGLDDDEYQAFETYPINFTLGQVVALASEFGVRGEQFWFPPPRRPEKVDPRAPVAKARRR